MPYVTGPAHPASSVTGAISADPVSAPSRCLAGSDTEDTLFCLKCPTTRLSNGARTLAHSGVHGLEVHSLDPSTSSFPQLAHVVRVVDEGLGKLLSERKEAGLVSSQ